MPARESLRIDQDTYCVRLSDVATRETVDLGLELDMPSALLLTRRSCSTYGIPPQ